MSNRYDRNMRFFGEEGQRLLSASHVAVIGIGGLGTHVIQQSAFLGVGRLALIDKEELDETNLNRYVDAHHDDPPGALKVDLGERMVKSINPGIQVDKIHADLRSREAFDAIVKADYVFGCLDSEGPRLILNELCAAYNKPYIDLASEILPGDPPEYGGRVFVAWDGTGCLMCCNVIDRDEAEADLVDPGAKRNRDALYGVTRELLGEVGPSVVSINGVVASLAVTEFMVAVTGIRSPKRLISYYGHRGIVTVSQDEPMADCYYCKGIRGKGDNAGIYDYIHKDA